MAAPLVSIVIPALNAGTYLGDTLRAIQELEYSGEIEVIVVDNGSTDSTGDIAKSFPVTLIEALPRNRAVARNRGVMASKGEILGFLDADCRPQRDWLETLVGNFKDDIVAVQGWIVPLGGLHVPYGEAPHLHQGMAYLDTKGFLIRREVFIQVGCFDESLSRCEDIDLGWKLSAKGHRLAFVDSTGVTFGLPQGAFHSIRRGVETGLALTDLYLRWGDKLRLHPYFFFKGIIRLAWQNRKRRSRYGSLDKTKRLLFSLDDVLAGIVLIIVYPIRLVFQLAEYNE